MSRRRQFLIITVAAWYAETSFMLYTHLRLVPYIPNAVKLSLICAKKYSLSSPRLNETNKKTAVTVVYFGPL